MSNQAVGKQAGSPPDSYPGKRFGLPETGPRSVAGVGQRLLALIIDWLVCLLVALAVFRTQAAAQIATYVLFAVQAWLLTALTGFTLGKRVIGLRVARVDGKPVGLGMGLLRTALLLLIVPALAFDKDLRGLHDKAARTIVIRTR